MSLIVAASKADSSENLKLEIWREIMRNKPDYYPGGLSGSGQVRPANDPVASATAALNTFNTLYPTPRALRPKKRGKR